MMGWRKTKPATANLPKPRRVKLQMILATATFLFIVWCFARVWTLNNAAPYNSEAPASPNSDGVAPLDAIPSSGSILPNIDAIPHPDAVPNNHTAGYAHHKPDPGCYWETVGGYTRKNGRHVSGYRRRSPGCKGDEP